MTLSIQTRCPQCYSLFDVLEEQLDQVDVKGRCGQCQQVFLVNDHLVVSTDSQPALLDNDFENNTSSFNQNGINNIEGRGSYNFASVIYRIASHSCLGIDTDISIEPDTINAATKMQTDKANKRVIKQPRVNHIQHSDENDLEAAALDSFNAWQTPVNKKTRDDNLTANSKQQLVDKVNQTSLDKAVASAINAKASTAAALIDAEPSRPVLPNANKAQAKSATVAHPTTNIDIDDYDLTNDDINNRVNDKIYSNSDEKTGSSGSKLLDKLVKNEQSLSEISPSVTHLTHLLTNKTTILDYQPSLGQNYNNQVLDRVQPTVASSSTPIATLLWIAGCAVLLLLLMAQYVIFNLNTLVKNPAHANRLQMVCSVVICGLPNADLSALNTTQLSIRRSKVNTSSDFSDLQAELVNNSAQAQLLPNLKVSVYSEAGLLGAFIAIPEDYLLSTQSQLAGEKSLSIMFTVPVSAQKINRFTIETLY